MTENQVTKALVKSLACVFFMELLSGAGGGGLGGMELPHALPLCEMRLLSASPVFVGDAGGVRSSGTPGATMQRGRAAPRQLRANKQIDK
jgi:hypothetical protein